MVTTTIQFTDRYGGNPPAWFRACLECEAMGCSPEPCPGRSSRYGEGPAPVYPCPRPAEHDAADFDGWHFLRCQECGGTGRVPWYVSVARIPRWFKKGAAFLWRMSDRRYQPEHFTYRQHVWLVFKCAFVYDLLRLFR